MSLSFSFVFSETRIGLFSVQDIAHGIRCLAQSKLSRASLVAQTVRTLPAMQETWF